MTDGIASLLDKIQEQGQLFIANAGENNGRKALLKAARELVVALESPAEVVARMNYLEPPRWAATRICHEVDLFGKLVQDNASPKTAAQLAEMTNTDPKLISRFLKHLAAGGFVQETGPDKYTGNAVTEVLATPGAAGITCDCFDAYAKIFPTLVDYFQKTNYQNPDDKANSPFSFATGKHYFDWLNQPGREKGVEHFKQHMAFKTGSLSRKWFDPSCLDVKEILDNPTDPSAALLVDVGGSGGHDIIGFHAAHPGIPGKLYLQDLPPTIQSLPEGFPHDAIKAQAHDFFQPQPVQGAKAYYLHMILHDWPDAACRSILENLKPAMKKGYSKILLNEIVVPDQGAEWFATSVDMIMMFAHASKERTESDWKKLLESVGLRLVKIWDCDGEVEKIVEAELA